MDDDVGDADPEPSQRPEPKSACTLESPIEAMIVAESAATGSVLTGVFQTLVVGKTGQPPSCGAGAAPEAAVAATATVATASSFTVAGVAPASRRRVA